LYEAFKNNSMEATRIQPVDTIAEGIAIAEPPRGKQILEAVKETNGSIIAVNDSKIVDSLKFSAKKGFFIEPTAAATIAGIKEYLDSSNPDKDEIIVSALTGHGLKATQKMLKII
jgi:threonine synthase